MPPREKPSRKIDDKIHELFGQRVDFCSIYAIARMDKKCPVKIGYADDVMRRLRELQTGNPDKLEIVALTWVVHWKLARRIEKRCHAILEKAGKRINGEWFDIDGVWAKKVIAVAAQEENIPLYSSHEVKQSEIDLSEFRYNKLIRMADMVLVEHDKGRRGPKSGPAARKRLVRRVSKTLQRIEGRQKFRVPGHDEVNEGVDIEGQKS